MKKLNKNITLTTDEIIGVVIDVVSKKLRQTIQPNIKAAIHMEAAKMVLDKRQKLEKGQYDSDSAETQSSILE